MTKTHLFYLDDNLYAFTGNKDLAKKFEQQRCMKKFIHRIVTIEDTRWSFLAKNHNSKLLIENPFDTTNGTIDIVTTYAEDESVTAFISKLESNRDRCISELIQKIGFDEKTESILEKGFSQIYHSDEKGGIGINLDAISILIWLFEPTFTGCGEIKTALVQDFDLSR